MSSPNRQIESMTRIQLRYFVVRVWRTEEKLPPYNNDDLRRFADSFEFHFITASMATVAQAFSELARVAAVEVLDRDGCGVIIYPDWK